MTILPDVEVSPLADLEFAPRCTLLVLCGCGHEHRCARTATHSARMPHNIFDGDHGADVVILLCDPCIEGLQQIPLPKRCRCGHPFQTQADLVADVRPLT